MQCYIQLLQSERVQLTYASQTILSDLDRLFKQQTDNQMYPEYDLFAYQLLHRILYYISLWPPETNEGRWCYQRFQLDQALYRLPTGSDAGDAAKVKEDLVHKCRDEVSANCRDLAQLIANEPPPDAFKLELLALYDRLISMGHFGLAAKVSSQLETADVTSDRSAIEELLAGIGRQMVEGEPSTQCY